MINKLGVLFLLILLTAPFVAMDYFLGSAFVGKFLQDQALQIMGTILALNLATAAFLVGHLTDIEMKEKKALFDNSMREIKHNIYCMLAIFLLELLTLTIGDTAFVKTTGSYKDWATAFGMALFLLNLFCLYEMTTAIFSVRKYFQRNRQ